MACIHNGEGSVRMYCDELSGKKYIICPVQDKYLKLYMHQYKTDKPIIILYVMTGEFKHHNITIYRMKKKN